ncbi:hypothetical protein [Nostoc sp. CHAB 5715]|uniref:hypothetical protein n=1 Tax=Nostoc sp. CHAB 5715 TaxID=2780400 RepID=UPI001E415396|nr:hypothetical protein [Nostoc sp. CHAB 5715]MCC5623879.1 hypothetical protein [Nostoc sp. CHAB 5715]
MGYPPKILCEAIADYHARIKSQEKEQSQEETAELEVLYTGIWLLKMKLGSSFLQNNSSDLKNCCPRKYYL